MGVYPLINAEEALLLSEPPYTIPFQGICKSGLLITSRECGWSEATHPWRAVKHSYSSAQLMQDLSSCLQDNML